MLVNMPMSGPEAAKCFEERGLAALILSHQTGDVRLYFSDCVIKDMFERVDLN